MQVADASEVPSNQAFRIGQAAGQFQETLGGERGGRRLLAGAGQDEGVGGPPGGALGFFRRVADVPMLQEFYALRLHVAGVREYFGNAILY